MSSRFVSIRVSNSRKALALEALVICKVYLGPKPEFGFLLSLLDMDVPRFARLALISIEEESKPADPEERWHKSATIRTMAG